MVNVNTPVSSSMELPFGEYTLFFFSFFLVLMSSEKQTG